MDADNERPADRTGEPGVRSPRVPRPVGVAHKVRTDDAGIHLTDRVVAGMITPAIEAAGAGVRAVRLSVDDEAITGIDVELAGVYGDRLREVADDIREVVRVVVGRLLGVGVPHPEMSIDVHWVDIAVGVRGLP